MEDVFRALADPTRRAVLDELTAGDGRTRCGPRVRLVEHHGTGSSRQAVERRWGSS